MTVFMPRSLRASIIAGAAALIAAAGGLLAPGHSLAQSAPASVTANLNQRAGPDTRYPVVVVVPAGSQVTLFGCLSDYSWCDGDFRGNRGWMISRYLQVYYQNRYVTVADYARFVRFAVAAFDLNAYWSSYYRNFPFYADRTRWAAAGRSTGIQIGVFYNRLSPHGNWVWVRGQYVWVPRVDALWRPYADGRWVYARTYGWVWVSNEPFGWATYHYGRWGFSKRIGWFWIPGTRWAPAWVAWRGSGDYLAWAPLPPDPQDSFSISISFGSIPNYYWQAVPATAFLSVNLSAQIVRDDAQLATVLQQTEPVGNVTIVNNVVVNNVINVEFVEEKTQEQVVTHDVALTTDPAQSGKTEGETIEIFHPPAEETPAVTEPPEVKPIEVVAEESQTKDQAGDEPATEDLVPPPPAPEEEAPPPTEAPPLVGEPAAAGAATEGEAVPTEEPAVEPAPEATQPPAEQEQPSTCPEGTILQEDGTCTAEEPSTPPVDEAAPPATAEEPPPVEEAAPPPAEEAAPPPTEEVAPPPTEEAAPAGPAPAEPEAVAPAPEQPLLPPCLEGYVLKDDGTCVVKPQ